MKINLAPMEGVVDWTIRDIYSRIGGYDHFVTEFVRVSCQLLPRATFYKYCPELHTGGKTNSGTPVYIQLLGGDPELMGLNAQRAVELGALGIDLNFGCPARRVNNHDGGANLLKSPRRLFDVITGVRKAIDDQVPVTAKIRLGFDNKDLCEDLAIAVDEAGAHNLTIHARTKVEGYKPPAHWKYIAKMKAKVSLPVIANGEIWTFEDYKRCREVSGCEDVALGRPAIARPDLALHIKNQQSQKQDSSPLTWNEVFENWLPEFILLNRKMFHDKFTLHRTKQWTKLMGRHYPESAQLFMEIKTSQELTDLFERIPALAKPVS